MNKLFFACGASYEFDGEPLRKKNGTLERYLTYVGSEDNRQRGPKLDGKHMNCFIGCPARVKDSGRYEFKAWVGKTEKEADAMKEPVRCVSCQPVKLEE